MPLPLVGGPTWRRGRPFHLLLTGSTGGPDTGRRCYREAAGLIQKAGPSSRLGGDWRNKTTTSRVLTWIALNKPAPETFGDMCAWAWCDAKESR